MESNTETKRKLASIQTIEALEPIDGADKIVTARVLGWRVVVKKTDFSVGDKCVFFELDSLIPPGDWNQFLRVPPEGMDAQKALKLKNEPYRLRTVKLRGVVSQGLALPVSTFPQLVDKVVGEDVTELMGVTKWEMEVPAQLQGLIKGNFPNFLKKTDEERIQANPNCFAELQAAGEVSVTTKMDGSSVTYYLRHPVEVSGVEFGACSRNLDLKDSEGNAYWNMARKMNLSERMNLWSEAYGDIALQGELCGPGIQGNKLGLKEPQVFFFNLFSITHQKYLSFSQLETFCKTFNYQTVPQVYMGTFTWKSIDEMLEYASSINYSNGTPAEGLVWRPIEEKFSPTLQGRLSVKTISNRFLLKYKE